MNLSTPSSRRLSNALDVALNRVGKRFGQRDALADLSFELQSGEMAFLTGHSGAGKAPYCDCYFSSNGHHRRHRCRRQTALKNKPQVSRSTGEILVLSFRTTSC